MPTRPSSTTAAEPHPRAALRNRNLPKLPDFEFPAREPSPQPETAQEQPHHSQQPRRNAPAPPSQPAQFSPIIDDAESKLDKEIEAIKVRQQGRPDPEGLQGANSQSERLDKNAEGEDKMAISDMSRKGQWIFYAITSGGCAAVNGVFAKLTTTEVTTNFATFLAGLIGLEKGEKTFEVMIRAIFFGLNLLFNGIMWALFTKALSRSPSTTQVSILNTSSNFMLTALLGFIIFSESLPPMWWLGASLLVAGNVIIGRREEKEAPVPGEGAGRAVEAGEGGYRDSREEGMALLSDDIELTEAEEELKRKRRIEREVEEDILDLEPPTGAVPSRI